MAATSAPTLDPRLTGVPPPRPRLFRIWACSLTVLLLLLFAVVTALTVTLWATDPGYLETNPVLDLAFFALGGIVVTTGIATQLHRPQVAGLQQSILGLAALALGGAIGGRIEPSVGAVILLTALTPLVALHPDRRRLLASGAGASRPLLGLTLAAAVPALVYGVGMLGEARAAGPSCFLGQCAGGDRLAEAGALAIAVPLVALLASLRTDGWKVPANSAALAAMVFGAASLLLPQETGALPAAGGVAALLWGTALIVVTRRHPRSSLQPRTP